MEFDFAGIFNLKKNQKSNRNRSCKKVAEKKKPSPTRTLSVTLPTSVFFSSGVAVNARGHGPCSQEIKGYTSAG